MPSEASSGDLPIKVLPKITVFGVGGAGLNAVNNMILSQIDDVRFVVANTDCQSLSNSLAENKIQLGAKCTKGLGAGAKPEVGKQAAEEALDIIKRELTDTDLLFIATGMGGGTGTGASPVIAKLAQDMGILTVAIATKPFAFEGKRRLETARTGITELESFVNALMVIDNQKLEQNNISMAENFAIADSVLRHAVYSIVDILIKSGFINRDFADVRTVLSANGRVVIGYGEDNDARLAAEKAIHNYVLENDSIYGAKNVLINISGSRNILKSSDIQDAVNRVKEETNNDNDIISGVVFDETLGDKIRVSVIAAGIDSNITKINNSVNINDNNNVNITDEKEKPQYQSEDRKHFDDVDYNNTQINPFEADTASEIEAPVFAKHIDEEDILPNSELQVDVEDIPYMGVDIVSNFVDKNKTEERKKKMVFGKKQLIENDNIDDYNNTYNQSNNDIKEGVFYIEQEELEHNNKRNAEIKVERKRRKNINTETTNEEHKQQGGLFDERKTPQKKSFIGRVLNAFNTSSFTIYEDKDSFLNDDDESDDFFSTPTIVRNKKLA